MAKLENFCYLKNVVALDEVDEQLKEKFKHLNLLVFKNVIEAGQKNRLPFVKIEGGECPFTFCYTSGTTGFPKGVV